MSKSSSFRYAIFGVTAAFMCGFLQALPFWGVPPTQASFARAARGVASLQGLEGYGTASLIDLAAGRLWQLGGASLLASGQWMGTFLGWTLAALASLGVVYAVVRLLDDARARGILFGSTIALILATCVPPLWALATHRSERVSDLRLFVPLELVEEVHRSDPIKVFANPAALGHLLLLAPDLAGGISIPESVRLSRNSSQWREGFRRAKWNVVLLSGPIGEYRPLLDHLLASPDWHLASVTNHGFLFRYGSGLAAPSLENSFRGATEQDTAVYLAQIASYYDAIRRSAEARACIE
ncbi:MAG TPA: hypothetical protein VIT23_09875, partial [Terrimicrobiaceae bacterium]